MLFLKGLRCRKTSKMGLSSLRHGAVLSPLSILHSHAIWNKYYDLSHYSCINLRLMWYMFCMMMLSFISNDGKRMITNHLGGHTHTDWRHACVEVSDSAEAWKDVSGASPVFTVQWECIPFWSKEKWFKIDRLNIVYCDWSVLC